MSITSIAAFPKKLQERLLEKWRKELGLDKKMKRVTQKIIKAEHVLKKAEKDNEKLTKLDKEVRDPKIKKCDMMMKSKKK